MSITASTLPTRSASTVARASTPSSLGIRSSHAARGEVAHDRDDLCARVDRKLDSEVPDNAGRTRDRDPISRHNAGQVDRVQCGQSRHR